MGIKETHSIDKNGKITQITGKSVHEPKTGKTEYYTREEREEIEPGGGPPGGSYKCHLTTACLKALNLPEDSLEFKAMKILTKEHILKSRQGKRDYILYNRNSPRIVNEIETRNDSQEIWRKVYEKLRNVARLVFNGNYEKGYQSYKSLVNELNEHF